MLSSAERLAQYVRSLPDFEVYQNLDCNYGHIGATVADAVLQANNKYKTHVKPRVNRIIELYPEAKTTTTLQALLRSISVTDFLSWRGEDRAERFTRIVHLFQVECLETEADLRRWLELSDNLVKLRRIKGIGPKTIDYFQILVGMSTSAIDRHLRDFLYLAGIESTSYQQDQGVINGTADVLGIDRALFDHSIWQFMSKRAADSNREKCRVRRGRPNVASLPL